MYKSTHDINTYKSLSHKIIEKIIFISSCIMLAVIVKYTHQKNKIATLDGEIMDPEITIKTKLRDVLKLYDVQT